MLSYIVMNILQVAPERLRNARPDSVANLGQLVAGQVVIGFGTYSDLQGVINSHFGQLAVVSGPPYRLLDGEVVDRGIGLGKYVRVEQLPSHTLDKPDYEDPTWLRVQAKGVEGVDEFSPPAGLRSGLLAVREEPYQIEPSLEVGPGLYVNGANDYGMLYKGQFMAI